jgi:UDP-N-acetylglucosamine acyltransferase
VHGRKVNEITIHPTAVVAGNAELGKGVEVGPYATIGDHVRIGDGSVIMHHVVIDRNTEIGKECKIFPFSSVGTDPQDISFQNEETFLHIGDRNIIREFTTINRGTAKGGYHTQIGDNNYFMAYVHIAHDARIGNSTQFVNGATLAGHVTVEDFAVVGAFASVHQFVRIGRHAYIGGYTIVLQDILPFSKVAQRRGSYSFYGPNSIGMMRNGFSRDFIDHVKDIYRIIFQSDLNLTQALKKIQGELPDSQEATIIIGFIEQSKRGILKNFLPDA